MRNTEDAPAARRGRRPGQTATRQRILESARELFAAVGYDQTSIRGVAEKASVDPALVMHYFGSKDGLFEAAIDWPFDMDDAVRHVFEGDPATMGERLVRMVCERWEDETTRHPLTVILRNAVQREEAATLMTEFVERQIVGQLVKRSKDPTAALRGSLAHSVILGLVMVRYLERLEPLASASIDEVVRAAGPTVQRYLAVEGESSFSNSG
ncbi:MAG: TetR family transcriptional regulator [Thermoleophilia bacterium]|nr:TetR family transcriptional regulator [Thermoleophilia bacterium]